MYALEIRDERTDNVVASVVVEVEKVDLSVMATVMDFVNRIFGIRSQVAEITKI